MLQQKPHDNLASSNRDTWPNSKNLIIGPKIDGTKLDTQNLKQLLNCAGRILETVKFACPETALPPTTFSMIGRYCPNIVSFEANCLDGVDLHTVVALSRRCRMIREFKLSDRRGVLKDVHLTAVLSSRWSLRALKVCGSSITKVSMGKLPPTLVHLDIRSCKYLTPHSLLKIMEKCPRLKELRTNFTFDKTLLDKVYGKWPDLQGLMITSTTTKLDVSKFKHLKDLFLLSEETVSLDLIVSRLKCLWRLHLVVKELVDEIITFECKLLHLRLETVTAMPNNVVQSLPYCTSYHVIEVFGTDIHAIIDQLLINCVSLKRIVAYDTVFEGNVLSKMLTEVGSRRKGPLTVVDANVYTT